MATTPSKPRSASNGAPRPGAKPGAAARPPAARSRAGMDRMTVLFVLGCAAVLIGSALYFFMPRSVLDAVQGKDRPATAVQVAGMSDCAKHDFRVSAPFGLTENVVLSVGDIDKMEAACKLPPPNVLPKH